MAESEVDLAFSVLPPRLRRRIDLAFDSALSSSQQESLPSTPSRKRRRLNDAPVGGGFVREDENDLLSAPGGFIIEDAEPGGYIAEDHSDGRVSAAETDESGAHPIKVGSHIPLSLIPTALQLLDLQPDDEDVLAVFRNAASGWGGSAEHSANQEQFVGRKDWRAVCAALLDTGDLHTTNNDDDNGEDMRYSRDESLNSEDEYQVPDEISDSATSNGASDDDYQELSAQPRSNRSRKGVSAAVKSKSSRKISKTAAALPDSDVNEEVAPSKRVTPRQRAECRRTFSLFFPDVPDESLDRQKLMIKDVTRVAALLKEKITAEEVS